jgi:hypothetical protein
MLQIRIRNGIKGAKRRTSLTHRSRLKGHVGLSRRIAMQAAVSLRDIRAAAMHCGHGDRLDDLSDGKPRYIEAKVEYSRARLACTIKLDMLGFIIWLLH